MARTRQERIIGVEETFATLRLDGLSPSPAAIRDAQDYIEGRRTLDEIMDRSRRFRFAAEDMTGVRG